MGILGFIKSLFGGSETGEQDLSFTVVPDGQFLVRYIEEKKCAGDIILVIFEITGGEHIGTAIPMFFRGKEAALVLREATGYFVSRLAGEEVGMAMKLEDNIRHKEDFLVRVADGEVVSVYIYNESKIRTFKNKLIDSHEAK